MKSLLSSTTSTTMDDPTEITGSPPGTWPTPPSPTPNGATSWTRSPTLARRGRSTSWLRRRFEPDWRRAGQAKKAEPQQPTE
jgi:hypothetical protein